VYFIFNPKDLISGRHNWKQSSVMKIMNYENSQGLMSIGIPRHCVAYLHQILRYVLHHGVFPSCEVRLRCSCLMIEKVFAFSRSDFRKFCLSVVVTIFSIQQHRLVVYLTISLFCFYSSFICTMEFDSCPTIAPFMGYMGVAASIILASKYSAAAILLLRLDPGCSFC
jgi:hypothetical protein